jgi:hypothetical protein
MYELRKRSGRDIQEYISADSLLCSNQLFDFFLAGGFIYVYTVDILLGDM